jgi:hypothetical protein
MKRSGFTLGVLCALVIFVLSGCGSSPQAIVAKNRAELSAKLDIFDRIATQLSALKAAPAIITIPAGAPAVILPDMKETRKEEVHNTMVLSADDFLDPDDKQKTFTDMFDDRKSLKLVKQMVRQNAFEGSGRKLDRALMLFKRARYALVFCLVRLDMPRVINETPSSSSSVSATFTPGHCEAIIQLFDLTKGDLIGGFMISANNSDEFKTYVPAGNVSSELQGRVVADLKSQIRKVLAEGIKKNVPGAQVP